MLSNGNLSPLPSFASSSDPSVFVLYVYKIYPKNDTKMKTSLSFRFRVGFVRLIDFWLLFFNFLFCFFFLVLSSVCVFTVACFVSVFHTLRRDAL